MAQSTKIFSKLLTATDIKKRLAIPTKILTSLPDMNGSHAVEIDLMYGTKIWPIVYSIRKKGYKKPVFSGAGWRELVIASNFNVGDELTLHKVQDETGSFHYMVQVEKPAPPSGDLSPLSFSLNHEVDETTGTSSTKACNFQYQQLQEQRLEVDAPIEQKEAITKLAEDAAMAYGTSQAVGDAYYKSRTERLSLDLIPGPPTPTPYAGAVNLDLTLAPPIVDEGH